MLCTDSPRDDLSALVWLSSPRSRDHIDEYVILAASLRGSLSSQLTALPSNPKKPCRGGQVLKRSNSNATSTMDRWRSHIGSAHILEQASLGGRSLTANFFPGNC